MCMCVGIYAHFKYVGIYPKTVTHPVQIVKKLRRLHPQRQIVCTLIFCCLFQVTLALQSLHSSNDVLITVFV